MHISLPARNLLLAALLWLGISSILATPASASHYRLEHAGFLTDDERAALVKAGIAHTKALLEWTATATGRARTSAATGLGEARLEVLATQCDLLRIPGFGPTMVEPLQKAGFRVAADLAKAIPADLIARLAVATRGTELHHRLPAPDTVATWIASARRLRVVLKGIPPLPTSG